MKVRDYLAGLETMPFGSLAAIAGEGTVVVLSPHPDDETLGCGGIIAALRDAGRRVVVVIVTDGAASHPGSLAYPRQRLAVLRRGETAAAAKQLGLPPKDIVHLDLPDAAVPSAGPEFEIAVQTIDELVREVCAGTLLVTWERDPHCDHVAVGAMARAVTRGNPALKLWFYPIWGLHLPAEAEIVETPVGLRFDISPWQDRKRGAIRCYASQMTTLIDDDPGGFRFTPETLAPFLAPFERFIAVRP